MGGGAQELKVINFVFACIVYVSIRIRRNIRRRKQEINCGGRGSEIRSEGQLFALKREIPSFGS